MSKRSQSAADRIWKEKLDMCLSFDEAVIVACVIVMLGGILLVASLV